MDQQQQCEEHLSFEDKELQLLRSAADKAEKKLGSNVAQAPEVKRIISIVEEFIRKKKLICYGGTAINNILPETDQFYEKSVSIPDYDFFSQSALVDAKELANIYAAEGYTDVNAKAGVHYGTYKVFVNYIPVADVTQLDKVIYKRVLQEAIEVDKILYAPANFLRMNMYLELSRPAGDVSRWDKVYKRLMLLNKNFPMLNERCHLVNFLRDFHAEQPETVYTIVRNTLIQDGVVFIGGFAISLYSRYMKGKKRAQTQHIPDFDVLALEPEKTAEAVKNALLQAQFKNVKVQKHSHIGELLSDHFTVAIGNDVVCMIFQPDSCRSYNTIRLDNLTVKVASIETLLNYFLAFIYADQKYYDETAIMCMAQYLFTVQKHNRLKQKGLLRRFSLSCYGENDTKESIMAEKSRKMQEFKNQRGTAEYEAWFLNYNPVTNKDEKGLKDKKASKTTKSVSSKKNTKQLGKRKNKTTKETPPRTSPSAASASSALSASKSEESAVSDTDAALSVVKPATYGKSKRKTRTTRKQKSSYIDRFIQSIFWFRWNIP